VPYDPYLPFVFQGEEILHTVRAFTHGYDFYAPLRNVAFHIYAMKENLEKRNAVHKFDENEILYPEVKKHSYLRLIGISGITSPTVNYFNKEEEKYGLGMVRTKEKFYETFGIHPSTRTIEEGLCDFVQGTLGVKSSMHIQFTPFLRYDKMGIDYSRIDYRFKTPNRSDTHISQEEFNYLRERLRQSKEEKIEGEGVNSKRI
jgi:hypothetical protein